jgi:hypothetical protein
MTGGEGGSRQLGSPFGEQGSGLLDHEPTLFAGLPKRVDLKLVSRVELASGAVALRYEPRH